MLIHLGDYVDRGPDSAGVLWLLSGSIAPSVTRRIDLQGNHEVMMISALSGDTSAAEAWVENGGNTTLESYRIPNDAFPAEWQQGVPLAHRQWMKTREVTHSEGGYLFVHAGLRPGRPMLRQSAADMLWIREPFLSSEERHPAWWCTAIHPPRRRSSARTVSASIPARRSAAC